MRESINTYFLRIAELVSTRSTCNRANVGCVLVSAENYILATGYNGSPRGVEHCIDSGCHIPENMSARYASGCIAVHAEQNALLQCLDTTKISKCYCTKLPCISCLRMLMNTPCKEIHYIETYQDSTLVETMWKSIGRILVNHE
jgi:dCMP deaminase